MNATFSYKLRDRTPSLCDYLPQSWRESGIGQVVAKGLFAIALWIPAAAIGQTTADIVGISIACSTDHVYTWYQGSGYPNVIIGTSSYLGAYQPYEPPHPFSLPPGRRPGDIIGIGIAGNDHVYAWYRDGTVSSGTSTQLDKYRAPYSYTLPAGKTPSDVVGMDIACSDDHVYVWYKDGTASSGTSDKLDRYRAPYRYSLAPGKEPTDVADTGIAHNDHVYVWYKDQTVSAGTSEKLDRYRSLYSFAVTKPPCEIYASPPGFDAAARVIFATGSRGPSCDSNANVVVSLREDIAVYPDKELARQSGEGKNFEVTVKFSCHGTASQTVFTEVESEGRKVQSTRLSVAYCGP